RAASVYGGGRADSARLCELRAETNLGGPKGRALASETSPAAELPSAKTKVQSRGFPWVWAIPVFAALVAGYLVYQRIHEFGPTITIHFDDVSGLKPGQTPLLYRGADIGQVKSIALSEDGQSVLVVAQLRRNAA